MILPGDDNKTLPKIVYEEIEGNITISGRSISNHANEYFGEFLVYFNDCMSKNPTDLLINIDLEYFNTQTARMMMNFLKDVKKIHEKGFKVKVLWFVDNGDEDLMEAGHDFQSIIKLDFEFIEKPEEEDL